MKIQKRIILAVLSFLMAIVFAIPAAAYQPPATGVQWINTKSVSCNILVTGTSATASAAITGKSGSSVQATVTLYKTVNGVTSAIYSESKTSPSFLPKVSFSYGFTVQSGATYYLELNGTVSKGGYDEPITTSDTEIIP